MDVMRGTKEESGWLACRRSKRRRGTDMIGKL